MLILTFGFVRRLLVFLLVEVGVGLSFGICFRVKVDVFLIGKIIDLVFCVWEFCMWIGWVWVGMEDM